MFMLLCLLKQYLVFIFIFNCTAMPKKAIQCVVPLLLVICHEYVSVEHDSSNRYWIVTQYGH